MTRESDILYEVGRYWICKDNKLNAFVVFRDVGTHSEGESAYSLGNDGAMSLAMARCNYLASRDVVYNRGLK
jgi:hypothetical protein